jgi:hypothetical protein
MFLRGLVADPLPANVRSDPRFTDLMREVKTRWETLGRNLPPPLRLVTAQQAPPKKLPFLVYQACAI